jgi:hypothetical protein
VELTTSGEHDQTQSPNSAKETRMKKAEIINRPTQYQQRHLTPPPDNYPHKMLSNVCLLRKQENNKV